MNSLAGLPVCRAQLITSSRSVNAGPLRSTTPALDPPAPPLAPPAADSEPLLPRIPLAPSCLHLHPCTLHSNPCTLQRLRKQHEEGGWRGGGCAGGDSARFLCTKQSWRGNYRRLLVITPTHISTVGWGRGRAEQGTSGQSCFPWRSATPASMRAFHTSQRVACPSCTVPVPVTSRPPAAAAVSRHAGRHQQLGPRRRRPRPGWR